MTWTRRIVPVAVAVAATVAAVAVPAGASSARMAAPVIMSFAATSAPGPAQGGPVALQATVADATRCSLSSKPVLPGLPHAADCSSGSASWDLVLPPDPTSTGVRYRFTLVATGDGGTRTAKTNVTVAPLPARAHARTPAHRAPRAGFAPTLLSGVKSLASTDYATCALLTSGGVDCWGYNGNGELGNGTTTDSTTPIQVVGVGGTGLLGGVQSLQNSEYGFCAVLTSGGVDCWGYNAYGELGNGTTTESDSPVQVVDTSGTGVLGGVQRVENGYFGFCAVLTSGGVDCWGLGNSGELGNGTVGDSSIPVQVVDVGGTGLLTGVQSLTSSYYSFCAVLTAGGVDCWGYAGDGELGNGDTTDSAVPVQVIDVPGTGLLSGVQSLVSSYLSYCAVLTSGDVDCWGYGGYGQLGNGATTDSLQPVQVVDASGTGTLSGVGSVGSNYYGFCAVLTSGGVDCWGYNGYGELGNGTTTDSTIPVQVVDVPGTGLLGGVQSLSSSDFAFSSGDSYCAVLTSGGVDCWGYNGYGQLGIGTYTSVESTPVQVLDVGGTGLLSGVQDLTTTYYSNCAVLASGGVDCWGNGSYGELGNGTTSDSATPVPVSGVQAAVAAFSIPAVVPPLQSDVTPGSSAGWAVVFSNPSTVDAKNVSAAVTASAGGSPVPFDLAAMSASGAKCVLVSSTPVSQVTCKVGTIPAGTSVTEYVEVLTTGLTDGTAVSATVDATSSNAGSQSGSLDPVTVTELTNGVIGLAVPGLSLVSSAAPLSPDVPATISLKLPKQKVPRSADPRRAGSTTVKPPPVPVTLQAVDPSTLPTLCNGHCLGGAVVAQGDFSTFSDAAHPISTVIKIYYGETVPSGTLYMLKPSGAVLAVPACVKVGGKYNTPCRNGAEKTVGTVGSRATQDTVYFVGTDPTFARRG